MKSEKNREAKRLEAFIDWGSEESREVSRVRKGKEKWSQESREVKRVGKEVCQERVCQVSGSGAVNRKGCQNSELSGASQIKRKRQHQTRMSTERNVKAEKVRPRQPDGQASFP